jgi:hypothetical protein
MTFCLVLKDPADDIWFTRSALENGLYTAVNEHGFVTAKNNTPIVHALGTFDILPSLSDGSGKFSPLLDDLVPRAQRCGYLFHFICCYDHQNERPLSQLQYISLL